MKYHLKLKNLMDIQSLMKQVKGVYQIQLDKDCADEDIKDDMNVDRNKIIQIVVIKYFLKTLRLFIIVLLLTYYMGNGAYICF